MRPCARILFAGLLAAFAAAPAAAQRPAGESGPPFVDLQRVLAEFQKTQAFAKYQARFREREQQLADELKALSQFRYCTEEEQREALAIKAKPKPSPEEQKRVDELAKKSDAVDNELATLSQKTSPTDAEAKRIQELSQLRAEAINNLARAHTDRREQLRKLDQDLRFEVQGDLLKVVEKVAKDRKLGYVLSRDSVLFGGVDLTDDVIKKLPK